MDNTKKGKEVLKRWIAINNQKKIVNFSGGIAVW